MLIAIVGGTLLKVFGDLQADRQADLQLIAVDVVDVHLQLIDVDVVDVVALVLAADFVVAVVVGALDGQHHPVVVLLVG